MTPAHHEAYRENWTRFFRDVAEAARKSNEDASHLFDVAYDARTRWEIPLPKHRKDQRTSVRALPYMVSAYAEQRTNAGRRGLAEPLLAWTKTCAELLGVPLADPPPTPYTDD